VGVSETDDYGIVRFAPFYIYLSSTSLGCGGLVQFREALAKDSKATSNVKRMLSHEAKYRLRYSKALDPVLSVLLA
jgi:hypothetical protein